ncbi:hypothetical protein [Allosalinactinospora lopnorensis]|uniref:hypothetical protein n=1 Tax=Allosalinactinospora lopnorensis TaxID=1352348 RepID=UPI000623F14D|nr:hypothetical protein [Allosalinactinospora lopnorensis]
MSPAQATSAPDIGQAADFDELVAWAAEVGVPVERKGADAEGRQVWVAHAAHRSLVYAAAPPQTGTAQTEHARMYAQGQDLARYSLMRYAFLRRAYPAGGTVRRRDPEQAGAYEAEGPHVVVGYAQDKASLVWKLVLRSPRGGLWLQPPADWEPPTPQAA